MCLHWDLLECDGIGICWHWDLLALGFAGIGICWHLHFLKFQRSIFMNFLKIGPTKLIFSMNFLGKSGEKYPKPTLSIKEDTHYSTFRYPITIFLAKKDLFPYT